MNNIVKLIIIGALIIAIPVTVKLVQDRQILKPKAAEGEWVVVSDGCQADQIGKEWAECRDGCNEGVVTCNKSGQYLFKSIENPSSNCGVQCGSTGGEGSSCQNDSDCSGGTTCRPAFCSPSQFGGNGCGFANVRSGTSCGSRQVCDGQGNCKATGGTDGSPTGGTPAGGSVSSKCEDGTLCKVSQNTTPPTCEKCAPVPDSSYKWALIPPGTKDKSGNTAPPIDAAKFGANNACGSVDPVAAHVVCPKNTTDSAKVRASTSNWCYEFTEGNRCIQLQYTGTGGGGGAGTDTGTCSIIDDQSPDLGPDCAACFSSKTSPINVPQVITNIKNMNPGSFSGCSNQKILNKWCNGFGAEAARQCNELKTGVCVISCGGSKPNPNPGSNDPKGWLDSATCDAITGWTCDGDDYNSSLRVDFYANGPAEQGVALGNATANLTREAAVGAECGGNANHGFSFAVPANSLRDGQPHNIYAYGINTGSGGTNQLLQGSPKSVTCTSSTPVRRDLCVSTTVVSTTPPGGAQLIGITSTSNEANLRNFRYAFYNRDNSTKIICQQGIISVVDAAETARQCPNGGAPLVIDKPAAANLTSLTTTFNSVDLSKPDMNWNNQIPTHFQVNGYFIDQYGMSSTANTNCSKPFDIAALPARMQGDADDNRCVNVDDYTIWKQEARVGGSTKKCANWTAEDPPVIDTEDYGIWYRAWKVLTKREGCIIPPAGSRCLDK